jgi:purine-nucleoside phosphorylase
MLKELTGNDWLSLLQIPEKMIPKVLILRGTRNLKYNYSKHKTYFKDIFEINSPNNIFEDVFIGFHNNIPVGYASVYGDTMASEITHVFGVLGTSLVIQTGCCGGLDENINPGDIINKKKEVEASTDLFRLVPDAQLRTWPSHKGPIWTTSALLAEGMEEIRDWHMKGYIAVDMETAATFATAEYFKMDHVSFLFAFDNPRQGEHILLDDIKRERRIKGEQTMLDIAFSIIEATNGR